MPRTLFVIPPLTEERFEVIPNAPPRLLRPVLAILITWDNISLVSPSLTIYRAFIEKNELLFRITPFTTRYAQTKHKFGQH